MYTLAYEVVRYLDRVDPVAAAAARALRPAHAVAG
jgi:hypothetical protein